MFGIAAIVAFLLALIFQVASISKGTFLTPHTMLYLGLVFLAIHLVYPVYPWRRTA